MAADDRPSPDFEVYLSRGESTGPSRRPAITVRIAAGTDELTCLRDRPLYPTFTVGFHPRDGDVPWLEDESLGAPPDGVLSAAGLGMGVSDAATAHLDLDPNDRSRGSPSPMEDALIRRARSNVIFHLLWSVQYADGDVDEPVKACSHCNQAHMLLFCRRVAENQALQIQSGVPVAGFIPAPPEDPTYFDPLAGVAAAGTTAKLHQLSMQMRARAAGVELDRQLGVRRPFDSNLAGAAARATPIAEGDAFPVVAFGTVERGGSVAVVGMLTCTSHFHAERRFRIVVQVVGINRSGQVMYTRMAQTPPLRIVSKFTQAMGDFGLRASPAAASPTTSRATPDAAAHAGAGARSSKRTRAHKRAYSDEDGPSSDGEYGSSKRPRYELGPPVPTAPGDEHADAGAMLPLQMHPIEALDDLPDALEDRTSPSDISESGEQLQDSQWQGIIDETLLFGRFWEAHDGVVA